MWVCVKPNLTKCGWVNPGRVVDDGDPMLENADPDCWERLNVDAAPVEEATAEPGKVRRTTRKGAQ